MKLHRHLGLTRLLLLIAVTVGSPGLVRTTDAQSNALYNGGFESPADPNPGTAIWGTPCYWTSYGGGSEGVYRPNPSDFPSGGYYGLQIGFVQTDGISRSLYNCVRLPGTTTLVGVFAVPSWETTDVIGHVQLYAGTASSGVCSGTWLAEANVDNSTITPGTTQFFSMSYTAAAGDPNIYQPLCVQIWATEPNGTPAQSIFALDKVFLTPAQPPCGVLPPGEALFLGQNLFSCSRYFDLNMQSDSNLVLYKNGSQFLWATNTAGGNAGKAIMQTDGNFVLYKTSGQAIWLSNTGGNPGAYLKLQDDGNLVIYDSTGAYTP